MLADTDKSEFGYIVPKKHVKQTVDVKVEKKSVKQKVEKPKVEKTESPVIEKSSVKQEEKKPLLWKDYLAAQQEQERKREHEKVPEKTEVVKRPVETIDETARRRKMAVMQAQKSNKARKKAEEEKVRTYRSTFQNDKRPLPDLSNIKWNEGKGNDGLGF